MRIVIGFFAAAILCEGLSILMEPAVFAVKKDGCEEKGAFMLAQAGLCSALGGTGSGGDAAYQTSRGEERLGGVPVIAPGAEWFPLGDVRLLEGPLKHSQDLAGEYLLHLETDRLLARFRQEAGLDKKAESYGGWEEKELPGVGLGFYLSGCAKMFAATGDGRFRERVEYAIGELATCQQAHGDGYLLATRNGKRIFKEIESGDIRWGGGWMLNGECEPYYAMEKLFSGLRDAYRYAGNQQALEIAMRLGDWLDRHQSHLDEQQMDVLMQCEYGGMNWVMSDLYVDTGDARYLALSRRWHDKTIEAPLAQGQDCLPGKHANTQFPKISGLAARYPYTGDISDRNGAMFFWDRVVNHHSYVTGGNSESEHFGPPDRLSDRLSPSDTELCNSYNMIRLTQLLFAIEPRAEYADYIERVLFNHVLAAQHPADGRICYFTPLSAGCAKHYEALYGRFSCCTCSSFDSYAKHAEILYAHHSEDLFVNQYASSEVVWREKGVTLRQETRFPDEDTARFTVLCAGPAAFRLNIRCPKWCEAGVTIRVNGALQSVTARPGSYAGINRPWQNGDTVEVQFPMTFRVESMPDNAHRVAFFYGPILLASPMAEQSEEALEEEAAPFFAPGDKALTACLARSEGGASPFTLQTGADSPSYGLYPFFRLHDQPYAIYWDIVPPEEAAGRETNRQARAAQAQALDARSLDHVLIGREASESAHQMQGENTQSGSGAYGKHMQRRWRHAASGGWFSYAMAVRPGEPAILCCTYWGKEKGARVFDILVNDTVIATQTLDEQHAEDFYTVEYPIPVELVKESEKVRVTFKPHEGNTAGGVFGVRVLKAEPNTP